MDEALSDLASQDNPNYNATAKRYRIDRTMLRWHFLGQQGSRETANSECRQRLTAVQEETLIRHINKLTEHGMPPTSQIVRNLAEEIVEDHVGRN